MSEKSSPIIRQLLWSEKAALRAHLLRLAPEDRRARFAGIATDATINAYVDSLPSALNSYRALGAFVDGVLRGVAECRIQGPYWAPEAELAFSVEHEFQRQGIGSELFRRMVSLTRNRGIRRIYILTERSNVAMHAVAHKHGMRLRAGYEVEGVMELEGPTPLSVAEEMLGEGTAWFCEGVALLTKQLAQARSKMPGIQSAQSWGFPALA